MSKKKLPISIEAKKKLVAYLEAWKARDWVGMLKASTQTFRVSNTVKYFKTWFSDVELLSYEIIKSVEEYEDIPAMEKVQVKVEIKIEGLTSGRLFNINHVQERAPYLPSVNGVWGVNPPSSLAYLQAKNVIVKKEK